MHGSGGGRAFKATKTQRREVKELALKGMSRREIADVVGVVRPTLVKYFGEELGDRRGSGGPPSFKATNAQRRKVKALALEGMSQDKIAKVIGVGRRTLVKYFSEELADARGSGGRPRFKATKSQRRKVKALALKGMSQDEIANVVGVGRWKLVKYFGEELGDAHGSGGRRGFKATKTQRRKVKALALEGMSQDEIAKVIGVGRTTLAKYFSEELVDLHGSRAIMTQRDKVEELARKGMSRREIADVIGVSKSTLVKYFGEELGDAHGSSGRPAFKATNAQRRKVKALALKGMSQGRIANVVGVNKSTLVKYFGEELVRRTQAHHRRDLLTAMQMASEGGRSSPILWLEQRIRQTDEPEAKPLDKETGAHGEASPID